MPSKFLTPFRATHLARLKVRNRSKEIFKMQQMNSLNDNTNAASGVAQNKNGPRSSFWQKGRSKSKLHFSPEADRNWKLINAFATRLGRKRGQRKVSVLEFVPSIEIFAWEIGMSLHSMKKNKNWFCRQGSIILILLEFPLPSVVAPILLSLIKAGSFSTPVFMQSCLLR